MNKIALLNSIPSEIGVPSLHTTLQAACQLCNVQMDLLKNSDFLCQVDQTGCKLFYQGKRFDPAEYQLAFLRFAIKASHSGDHYVTREFERQSIPVVNSPSSLILTKDKLQTLQMLSHLDLPITPSYVVRTREQIPLVLQQIGQGPYIVKNIFGSGGRAVLQGSTQAQVMAIFDYVWNLDRNQILLIQPYLGPTPAQDIRALFFNFQPWRAIERHASYDFRANVHIGATTEATILTSYEQEICTKAVKASGLILAGIDFLRTEQGPTILEVNGCPGFTGISSAYARHGIDIISELATHLVNYTKKKMTA